MKERRSSRRIEGAAFTDRADRRSLTVGQTLVLFALALWLAMSLLYRPAATGSFLVLAVQIGFLAYAAWRVLLVFVSRRPVLPITIPQDWPRYTIVVALLDEAEIVGQLIKRLERIDYPPDRLEAFVVLEAHDHATLDAILAEDRPDWLRVLIAPDGSPRTKPRALNHALARATGEFINVYDAEDDPDPLQLREAASRFCSDKIGAIVGLQAPLRIRAPVTTDSPFIDRQFAAEYAGLFEVTLPAMANLGLPFPLGGTSNHFRVAALKAVGGWDAHNVTEDADLGFRLWRAGGRLGVLSRPTWEPPPGGLDVWLPQRTRWLKGFMQTLGVHTRTVSGLGVRGAFAMVMSLGAAVLAAAIHAASLAWVASTVMLAAADGLPPETPRFALSVLILGTLAAWLTGLAGAKRAHVPYSVTDMLMAPVYWSLLSLAFVHAFWRLILEPHTWDKTRHHRDPVTPFEEAEEAADAGRRAA